MITDQDLDEMESIFGTRTLPTPAFMAEQAERIKLAAKEFMLFRKSLPDTITDAGEIYDLWVAAGVEELEMETV